MRYEQYCAEYIGTHAPGPGSIPYSYTIAFEAGANDLAL